MFVVCGLWFIVCGSYGAVCPSGGWSHLFDALFLNRKGRGGRRKENAEGC